MAIPKRYKKGLMKDVKNLDNLDNLGKKEIKWQFKPGDLVMTKAGIWGVIVEATHAGYFYVMSSSGRIKIHAKQLERIQRNKSKS